jgi:hypothetical protein
MTSDRAVPTGRRPSAATLLHTAGGSLAGNDHSPVCSTVGYQLGAADPYLVVGRGERQRR